MMPFAGPTTKVLTKGLRNLISRPMAVNASAGSVTSIAEGAVEENRDDTAAGSLPDRIRQHARPTGAEARFPAVVRGMAGEVDDRAEKISLAVVCSDDADLRVDHAFEAPNLRPRL